MEKENKHKCQRGPIIPIIFNRIIWENSTNGLGFLKMLFRENDRLFAISKGKEEGDYGYIPDGWFDYEEQELGEDMGKDKRTGERIVRFLKEYGLVRYQLVKKSKLKSNNGRKTLLKNLYQINWELLDALDEKYPTGNITLDMIREMNVEPSCYTQNRAVEAPKTVEISNPTPATIEAQECRKECDIAVCERTLENHPEEDEEIIDIMFNIVGKENPGGLIEEYCQGHQENAELMRHYFKLYMREKSERENAMYSTKKDIQEKNTEVEDTVEMPADLSRKIKIQLQPYLKNVPEPILNTVMDSMYKAKVGKIKREKWQLNMLPALNLEGTEGKIWIQQLWNNF